ncbi:MAG: PID-CTERM protein-sorting domain-containing protein [Bacteroidia bacterium]
MKHTLVLKAALLFTLCLIVSQVALAQPPPPVNPSAVPIDGGLSLLLAAGAGLGAKKMWGIRKVSKD